MEERRRKEGRRTDRRREEEVRIKDGRKEEEVRDEGWRKRKPRSKMRKQTVMYWLAALWANKQPGLFCHGKTFPGV
jgi:hypothetical protein